MGNSDSQMSKRKSKRRRPSVHSGKLYIPSIPESTRSTTNTPNKSHHFQYTSEDFAKSASDLKENLPEDLKIYCNSIEVMYRFWCKEIETLNELQYKEACVLFYVNVFKLIPDARPLFTKNIELQAKQFFGMFRWLITNLKQPDAQRLIKRIKILGKMHKKMNIKIEWYQLLLQAFHDTIGEITNDKYSPRTRFCMEQLYTVVMNIMLDNDFESLSSEKISFIIKSLGKLEDCLDAPESRKYLEMYAKQQFCVELMLFYTEWRRFKGAMSSKLRQQIGIDMLKKFIDETSECEINISWVTKNTVIETLKLNNNQFAENIYDECVKECVELIRNNIWNGFKRSILKMAVDADINYDAHKSKSNLMDTKLQLEMPQYSSQSSETPQSSQYQDEQSYF